MKASTIIIKTNEPIDREATLKLYESNAWSSADKPEQLLAALNNAHTLISAFIGKEMVGLAYAISDGHLVVYYPHMLVHPAYQGKGIGSLMMKKFQEIYGGFHMQMLTADGKAIEFYQKQGFKRAGKTISMWKYDGDEH